MQRVALLNWKNKNKDYDLAKIFKSLAVSWVVEWLEVQSWKVTPGYAFIDVIRDWITFPILFENSSDVIIDTSWTKKVYIEIDQTKVDDWSINNVDWTWIAVIVATETSYPSENYISLASIDVWVITDERKEALIMPKNLVWEHAWLKVGGNGNISIIKDSWELWTINVADILVEGIAINLANWLLKLNSSWKIDPWFFDVSPVKGASYSFIAWENIEKWDALFINSSDWKVYPTDPNDNNKNTIIWFANNWASLWWTVFVNISWADDNQTSLIIWDYYYLWYTINSSTEVSVQQTNIGNNIYIWDNAETKCWQTFTLNTGNNIVNYIDFKIRRVNDPTSWVYAKIYDWVWWTLLATSINTIPYNEISSSFSVKRLEFDEPLWTDTTIFIEFLTTSIASSDFYVIEYGSSSYSGWTAYQYSSWWSSVNWDIYFDINYTNIIYNTEKWKIINNDLQSTKLVWRAISDTGLLINTWWGF